MNTVRLPSLLFLNAGVMILNFFKDRYQAGVNALVRARNLGLFGIGLGLLLGKIGYHYHLESFVGAGQFLLALSGFVAVSLLTIVWANLALIDLGAHFVGTVFHSAGENMPHFLGGPWHIPELVNTSASQKIMRESMALLTWVGIVFCFAAIVPAYQDWTSFLTCMTLATFLAWATYGWGLQVRFPVQMWLVWIVASIFIVKTLMFFVPTELKKEVADTLGFNSDRVITQQQDERMLQKEIDKANHGAVDKQKSAVDVLSQQREVLLSRLAANGTLNEAERAVLDELNDEIQDAASSELVERKDYDSAWSEVPIPKIWAILLLGLGFVALLLLLASPRPTVVRQENVVSPSDTHRH